MEEKITISRKEYEDLKRKAEIDYELVEKMRRAFEDIKHVRVRRWKPIV